MFTAYIISVTIYFVICFIFPDKTITKTTSVITGFIPVINVFAIASVITYAIVYKTKES